MSPRKGLMLSQQRGKSDVAAFLLAHAMRQDSDLESVAPEAGSLVNHVIAVRVGTVGTKDHRWYSLLGDTAC